MDKLKKNVGLKCVAVIVFSVSVLAFIVSGIVGVVFFDKGVYGGNGIQKIYDDCIQNITAGYEIDAINYFEENASAEISKIYDLNSYNGNSIDYYYRLMEGNTNFYFDITPTEKADREKYPSLTNITGDINYCYKTENVKMASAAVSEIFKYNISVEDINKKGTVFDDSYYEIGLDEMQEYYYVDINDTEYLNYTITNDYIKYDLLDDEDFVKDWKTFCKKYGDDAEISIGDAEYDYVDGVFKVNVYISYDIPVHITEYVASEFTAHDKYYNSVILSNYNLLKVISEAVLPVLIISVVLMITTFIYLIISAGHRKDCDGIRLNNIDRIPYDIMLLVLVFGCFFVFNCVLYTIGYKGCWTFDEMLLCIAGGICGLIYLPAFIMTTATRLKCHMSIIENTVILKCLRRICGIIKYMCKKTVGVVKLLIINLNLYWKYLGILCLAAFIEFCAMASGNMSQAGFIGLVIFVLLLFIMIKAIINMEALKKGASELANGNTEYEIDTNGMMWEFKQHGENLNRIKDGIQLAVDERMKSERMKTELISNVSHDIKTPLTSIISYVDLLEKENIDNITAREYIDVLERQADRLKKLIQDLIDASKASTGNLAVNIEQVDLKVLLEQAMGEFSDKLAKRGLNPIITYNTEPHMVMADGQHLWRIFQNIINNIAKYAQDNTRVYIDVDSAAYVDMAESGVLSSKGMLKVVFKNISKDELNVSGDELMERFVRGDSSRNTEGSGLGLSIAEGLAKLQGGNLEIIVDGDLFKVVLLLVRA